MKKKMLSMTLALVLLACLFTGCGASSASRNYAMSMPQAPGAAPMREEMAAEMDLGNGALTSAQDATAALPEARKWIVTMHISAETEDLDAMTDALNEQITAMNGYIQGQHVYNGSNYSARRYRSASMTIRIPADRVDNFTENVAGIANVVSKEKNLEDITLRYVATESRMTALQTEEARLLELLAKAETMSDLLEIEGRLTDVRSELEQVTSQMRVFDNQIDYATVYLNVDEVQEYTPVEEPTFGQRIRDGFKSSLKGLGSGAVDLTVWLIANSPYLLLWGLLIAAAIPLVKRIRKARRAKKAAKENKE